MKAILILMMILLTLACVSALALPDAPVKVTLDANDMAIKDAAAAISEQTGAQVLLDTGVTGKFTGSLNGVESDRAIDVLAKSLRLEWKRVELAIGVETSVSPEKVKAAIAALSVLDIPAMSIADPATGKVRLVATGLGQNATSEIKLPEGQKWQTCYLISSRPAPKPEQTAKDDTDKNVQQEVADRTGKIVSMSPEERRQYFHSEFHLEMQLPQDARRQIWQDRIAAFGDLMRDPVNGPMLQREFRQAMRSMRQDGDRNTNRQ